MPWRTGNTFHCRDVGSKAHLYIIICQDGDSPMECVIVNVTTIHNDLCDKSCVLDKGDHPFIKQPSSVLYRKAEIAKVEALERAARRGDIWTDQDIDPRVLVRVQQAALRSTMVSGDVKAFLKKHSGV